MIYLSGAVRKDLVGLHPRFGFLQTPVMGNARIEGVVTAADSGLYGKPKNWTLEKYLAWLTKANSVKPSLLFATAPDVVCDAAGTLRDSLPVLPQIRALGIPAAFVAQNGIYDTDIPWGEFDCLFVGGDDIFKLGSEGQRIIWDAIQRNKWVHVGRVNSWKRLKLMYDRGADSVDGTYIKYGPDTNAPEVYRWLEMLEPHRKYPLFVQGVFI